MEHNISTIFSTYLIPLGVFIAAISYVVTQWRQGGTRASVEVIATYREQVTQLKEQLKEQAQAHTDQINSLTTRVGELQGQLQARDTLVNELKNILTDREKNPEMLQFYSEGLNYFKEAKPLLEEIKQHLIIHAE